MTFEQFQATKRWSDDICRDCEYYAESCDDTKNHSGNIYLDSLVIERVQEWWPEDARQEGEWYLLIERSEYITDDLEALERILYQWAGSAGFYEAVA